MKLKDFIKTLDPGYRKNLIIILKSLANENNFFKRMIINIFREHCLEFEDWRELCSKLLASKYSLMVITSIITEFCRNGRSLIGPDAQIKPNILFGRAITFDRFCGTLHKMRYKSDLDAIKADIRYRIGMSPSLMESRWMEQELGLYIMWATFNPNNGKPFGDQIPQAFEILCVLGLEPDFSPVILFEYHLPPNISPKVPTICDAYAGGFSRYFNRVTPNSPYGITNPTDLCPNRVGKPEVVHEVIKANSLINPLRYA